VGPRSGVRYDLVRGRDRHNNLAQSTTLTRQKRHYVPIDHNQFLLDAYEACLPHYQAMHPHRLTG